MTHIQNISCWQKLRNFSHKMLSICEATPHKSTFCHYRPWDIIRNNPTWLPIMQLFTCTTLGNWTTTPHYLTPTQQWLTAHPALMPQDPLQPIYRGGGDIMTCVRLTDAGIPDLSPFRAPTQCRKITGNLSNVWPQSQCSDAWEPSTLLTALNLL